MTFKGTPGKAIHRLGYKFESDEKGILWNAITTQDGKQYVPFNIDELKKRVVEIDTEGNETITKEAISNEEKEELLSAFKVYGFEQVIEWKKKD